MLFIVNLLIGGVLGYFISISITAKNLWIKLFYGIGLPISICLCVLLGISIFANTYIAGTHAAYLLPGSIAYTLVVLIKMNVKKRK